MEQNQLSKILKKLRIEKVLLNPYKELCSSAIEKGYSGSIVNSVRI
jgi:hypothetical protein